MEREKKKSAATAPNGMNVKLLPSANKAPIKMSMKSFLRLQYIPNILSSQEERKAVTMIVDDKDTECSGKGRKEREIER